MFRHVPFLSRKMEIGWTLTWTLPSFLSSSSVICAFSRRFGTASHIFSTTRLHCIHAIPTADSFRVATRTDAKKPPLGCLCAPSTSTRLFRMPRRFLIVAPTRDHGVEGLPSTVRSSSLPFCCGLSFSSGSIGPGDDSQRIGSRSS